ncbi:MAG: bifunctional UDP-N-acetylmuramoyl-tripeptide:D-alanyl-D-alanine ligase/alanine racemase [Saprospiraceae bacterium]
MNIHQIALIVNAEIIGIPNNENVRWNIETDSRNIINPDRTIFVALNGTHSNGIKFIPDLIKRGVKYFIVDQEIKIIEDACILRVSNSLAALQLIAKYHRSTIQIPIIGITGSNGKTIIKEWLSQLLSSKFIICKSPKSYNSQLGVALSLLELKADHEIGIFEAGISQMGEMINLKHMINPTIGILSNIGDAHDAGFNSQIEKLSEKIKLFENSEYFYYCGDQDLLNNHLASINNAISWGTKPYNKIQIKFSASNSEFTKVLFTHKDQNYSFELPFNNEASIENIIPCLLIALDFNLQETEIQSSINKLRGMKLRLEQKEGINGCILINDSYSLDLKSLKLSFQFSNQQNKILDRVLIISDFVQQVREIEVYVDLAQLIAEYSFSTVIGIGEKIQVLKELLNSEITFTRFSNVDEFVKNIDQFQFKNQLILLKGARTFHLERAFEELSLSNHESILEINLKTIAHNLSVYRSFLKKSTKLIAVVKASAYGTGNYEIARYLEHLGINFLAVAYQDEAVLLRNKGIQCSIMVLNSGLADFEELIDRKIEPVIFSLSQIRRLLSEISINKQIRIHIKLDTGMRRLGFMKADMDELVDILMMHSEIQVISIFSHLSGSESVEFDEFSKEQFKEFEFMYNLLTSKLNYMPFKHILNSGGISRHSEYQFDAVRIGIGMYGVDSNPLISLKLEKTHKLKTKITQIKNIKASDHISYNQSGQLMKDGKIAILSIGYADGLPRSAGINQHEVFIQGKKCPLVGAVCMDMCMVDISQLNAVQEGEEVEIFGVHAPIESLAIKCNLIPYEIICGISHRVKRIYIEE